MPNESFENPDQTHLGWRSLSTDGGEDQDKLFLRRPIEQTEARGELPLVTFLDSNAHNAPEPPTSDERPSGAIEDSTLEAPTFLWSSNDNDDTATSRDPGMNQDATPVVVFSGPQAEPSAQTDSATIFS